MACRIVFALILIFALSCSEPTPEKENKPYLTCDGFFEGEVFQVAYRDSCNRDLAPVIDSALRVISSLLSMNDPQSMLSRINAGDTLTPLDGLFLTCIFNLTHQHEATGNRFHPFLYSVCERWGLGNVSIKPGWRSPQKSELDSLLKQCDPYAFCFVNAKDPEKIKRNIIAMDTGNVEIDVKELYVSRSPKCKLDLRGIIRGMTADMLSDIMEMECVDDYCIQIGQVFYTSGEMMPGKLWTVGIEQPDLRDPLKILLKLELSDGQCVATTGFDSKVRSLQDGDFFPFVHFRTGERIRSEFHSYSVITDYAGNADAWATVFLSLGKDSAFRLAKEYNLELIYIYRDEKREFKWEATELIGKKLTTTNFP